MILLKRKILVTLNILYWMPDHRNILQEFTWQTDDIKPQYPKVHNFLCYWHNNIDAVISEIRIADSCETKYRSVKEIINY